MDTHSQEHEQLLLQSLQVDVQVAEFQAEEYRRLFLSLIGQGVADATTQVRTDVRGPTISKSREELSAFPGSALIHSCRGARGQKPR